MFGYVVINKPELKFREFDLYQTYYCGLCRTLKKEYGRCGQLTLNYDMTFLVLLLTGLYEPENTEGRTRCIAHPLRRHYTNANAFTAYGAAMNVLLSYYKCLDDWNDDKSLGKLAYAKLLEKKTRDISARYPRQADAVRKNLDALYRFEGLHDAPSPENAEEKETSSDLHDVGSEELDVVSGYFGSLMSELFVYAEDEWQEPLRRLGFYLGKFIYLADAYDDLEKDEKAGKNKGKHVYNPLLLLRRSFQTDALFDEYCARTLTMMMAECTKAFELLPIVQSADILRNILYSGVWTRFEWRRARCALEREKKGKQNGPV